MTGRSSPNQSPEQLARQAIERVLRTQWDGIPAVRLDSPPGAGKTGVAERLALQSLLLKERSMVVSQTNEQAFDIARRLGRAYPQENFHLFTRSGLLLPPDLSAIANLSVVTNSNALPTGPCAVIANAAKWSWIQDPAPRFDLQIVDEAFQLTDGRFHQIAGLAQRVVLIGDPGQIAPVVACEVERWKGEPSGPHTPCPRALTHRHPGILQLSLPVSRRLVEDTVQIVQPAFYPELRFVALSSDGERGIRMRAAGATASDAPLNVIARGASLAMAELPAQMTGEVDEELASVIVNMIERFIARGAEIFDRSRTHQLTPTMIGVVCAHVSQVNAVRERLPAALSQVFVETADRFQGLERPLMLVHHPLSGRADATEFHLDAGRLCVMMSRHSVSCCLVGRAGIDRLLHRYTPTGTRVLGVDQDYEYEGWRAQMLVMEQLRIRNRVVSVQL
jgi:hypothetical protein